MSQDKSSLRTPLGRVRGLGSAKSGTEHFFLQRLTALANVPLTIFVIFLVISTAGSNYAAVKGTLGSPIVSIPLIMFIISATYHMRIGMQVIIEDYVHSEGLKVLMVMLNTFVSVAVGLSSVFAVLKLSFGV